jgi:hypothetical protein
MKTRVIRTFSIALLFGLTSIANAQLKAGSPEEAAYKKIDAENNSDAKLALVLEFEKQFPEVSARVMSNILLIAMDIYSEKDNKAKISEYGDKAINKDPDNVSALLRVSRNYAAEKTNLDRAVDYAEKAKKIVEVMRSQPVPTGTTEAQYKQWLDANAQSAEQYASYARTLRTTLR